MKRTVSLVLVLALGLAVRVADADFTFGEPVNLGPTVNSSARDENLSISADGLSIYYCSLRPGGYGGYDMWVTTRATTQDDWGSPVNLGSPVNSSTDDFSPDVSADGLMLYFASGRPGGSGYDIWVAKRATTEDAWPMPVNLGPMVNSSAHDGCPAISDDGLELYFWSNRSGGFGLYDIWVARRETKEDAWDRAVHLGSTINSSAVEMCTDVSPDGLALFYVSARSGGYGGNIGDLWLTRRPTISGPWGQPVNLGPIVNGSGNENGPCLSADGSVLYFSSGRPGGIGQMDLWQVSIEPVVDLNGDGIVDAADMCIIVDHWGENYPLCDIGPTPLGDGIVDVKDLIVLAEHLFEGIQPVEPEEVNVDEEDASGQVELEQGQILVVTLESNPTTGYGWEVAENQESILEQMGDAEFKQSETGEPLVGAGGWEIFRFKAISAGQMTLQLVYRRSWEESVEPLKTFSLQVVVR
jgi:predicted secreted protein/Tol biopolymer transport system component